MCTKGKQPQISFKNFLTPRQVLKFLHLSLFFCLSTYLFIYVSVYLYNVSTYITYLYTAWHFTAKLMKTNKEMKSFFNIFLKYDSHTIIFILLNYTIKSFKVNSQRLTFLIINSGTLSLLQNFLPLSLWRALIYFLSLKNYSSWTFHISETIKCTIFCAWQFSVSITLSRFIHVVVCINSTIFYYSWRAFHCMEV